jgi:hypothetical protein
MPFMSPIMKMQHRVGENTVTVTSKVTRPKFKEDEDQDEKSKEELKVHSRGRRAWQLIESPFPDIMYDDGPPAFVPMKVEISKRAAGTLKVLLQGNWQHGTMSVKYI